MRQKACANYFLCLAIDAVPQRETIRCKLLPMDVAPWIRVFGAILDTVPSACYKSFGLRSIKDADVLSEKKLFLSLPNLPSA